MFSKKRNQRQQLAEVHLLAIMNQMDLADYAEIGYGAIGAVAKNISSKTYLKSLSDFITAFSSGEWSKYGRTKLGSFVPNIVKGIANDPLYRETRTLTDTLKTRTGFYGDVDPSFNALGETRTKNITFMDSFFNPFTKSGLP